MSDPYDPQEAEERRRGSQYVTRKDFRVIGIVLVILALAAWPVYLYLLGGVNDSLCKKNLRKISTAIQNYVSDNEEHFPFAYERADYSSTDVGLRNGYAYGWQWPLQAYIKDWKVLRCPAADDAENSKTSDGTTAEASSYGMLNAYSGIAYSMIPYPDQKALISETAKNGANHTFDPLPLMAGGKPLVDDGFVIGFNDDQNYPSPQTKSATRLAFPDTANGQFNHDSRGRHPEGIHFLMAGGGLRTGDGASAQVIPQGANYGEWDVPRPTPRSAPKLPKP